MRRYLKMKQAGMLAVLLMTLAGSAAAQDLPAGLDETDAVSSLPLGLLTDADAVVQLEFLRFAVSQPGKATRTVRRVVTVLNADGRDAGELYIRYDNRLRRLKKLRGWIRDDQGKVIRKLGKDDQDDYSAISGYSLYEENRVRVARLYHDVYPYTIEFEYEVLHDGLINWPTWCPQQSENPVAFAHFELEAPVDIEVRYQVRGGTLEPAPMQRGNRKMLRWEIQTLPALELEPYGPSWEEQVLCVHTAPTAFEIEGSRGDMRSWESFGQWYYDLSEGRDVLPPEARREVHRRIIGLSDDREKVRRLYTYLQEKTRYISIQLGLGGWQPFDATYVHERGYGDCKALTNYMRALLKEVGIRSFPALVRSGERAPAVLPGFPSNQFDHVILSVPLKTDTLWLDSTSPLKAFGHLGSFTEDRYALLVKPEDSQLVRTPRSRAPENTRVHHARVRLTSSGDATAQVRMHYTGNQQDDLRHTLAPLSGREREAWLREHLTTSSFELVNADFSEIKAKSLAVELPVALELPRYASRTGKRLFVPVNLMERWSYLLPPVEERTQPVKFFPYAFVDVDTVHYALPDGFRVETLPDAVNLETSFGRYKARVLPEQDGLLVYQRWLEISEATLPAAQYEAFRVFLRQVAQADLAQVVLVSQ